jgi:hypothetical protein
MTTTSDLNAKFVKPILKALLVVLGGFLIAPSHALLSFYQNHAVFRYAAILVGSFIVILALYRMLEITLNFIASPKSNT